LRAREGALLDTRSIVSPSYHLARPLITVDTGFYDHSPVDQDVGDALREAFRLVVASPLGDGGWVEHYDIGRVPGSEKTSSG
jgi:hypothetical protein